MGQFTEKQKSILVGSILGDGYIHLSPHKTASFEIRQSVKHQDYLSWMWDELQNFCSVNLYQRTDNQQWRLRTKYLSDFALLHNKFYAAGKKIIPKDIVNYLKSPLSLAVWYMEDGTLDWRLHDHYAFRIATNCFSLQEHNLLISALRNNFLVEATVQKTVMRGKLYYRLHIGASGRNQFLKLIKPYIVPSFRYKLPPVLT